MEETPKEREIIERGKAWERLMQCYAPWAERWREEHGDEPVPPEVVAQWVERAKALQTHNLGVYYTPRSAVNNVYDPAMGSGGFLVENPPYGDADA